MLRAEQNSIVMVTEYFKNILHSATALQKMQLNYLTVYESRKEFTTNSQQILAHIPHIVNKKNAAKYKLTKNK